MADKRMFTKKITDSDAFIEMSSATQALYFHLNQGADDDGFNNQVQMAMWKAHASVDDLKVLMAKNYIIRFESGVIVIKHWRMHNTLRKDRYTPTNFQEELNQLGIKDNGAYTLGCQVVAERLPDGIPSIGKVSIVEDSVVEDNIPPAAPTPTKHIYGEHKNVRLTDEEVEKLKVKFPHDWSHRIENLSEGIARKGYKYQSHYLAILNWAKRDGEKREKSNNPFLDMYIEEGGTL